MNERTIQMQLSDVEYDRMLALKLKIGSPSLANLLRYSVQVLAWIVKEQDQGRHVGSLTSQPDGWRELAVFRLDNI